MENALDVVDYDGLTDLLIDVMKAFPVMKETGLEGVRKDGIPGFRILR